MEHQDDGYFCGIKQCPPFNDKNQTRNEFAADFLISSSKVEPKASRFPENLNRMISKEENSCAIKWAIDGLSFIIVDKGQLENNVLGKYFRSNKYPSFRRKLNRWGFKLQQDEYIDSATNYKRYSNEFFQRDKKYLLQKMKAGGEDSSIEKIAPNLLQSESQSCFHHQRSEMCATKRFRDDDFVKPVGVAKKPRFDMHEIDYNVYNDPNCHRLEQQTMPVAIQHNHFEQHEEEHYVPDLITPMRVPKKLIIEHVDPDLDITFHEKNQRSFYQPRPNTFSPLLHDGSNVNSSALDWYQLTLRINDICS